MADRRHPNASEDVSEGAPGRAYERLHPQVQDWVWRQGWKSLRDIQERSVPIIVSGERDVVIAAATAGGKTEAAFLPIVSRLAELKDAGEVDGLGVLAVSPLKALINDQHRRLESLFEAVDLPVHRWHGDVAASHKNRLRRRPRGGLLITPESLEALFVRGGPQLAGTLAGLRYLVVDEMHAFIGTERGRQLQSLLHRVERLVAGGPGKPDGSRPPRIALSATLGDMRLACEFLRPGEGSTVEVIVDGGAGQEVQLAVRTFVQVDRPDEVARGPCDDEELQDGRVASVEHALADEMFRLYRGGHHLVFANRRADVETFADLLRRASEHARVPDEFWPHHGSLSKTLRTDAEDALRSTEMPATVIATTTLELGIDVGAVESTGQIRSPSSVASLRQRLGRSGRRPGDPAVLRIFLLEQEPSPTSSPLDRLHVGLVQTVAVVRLLAERWYEPPPATALHLSTLVQQVLSVIASRGGAFAAVLYELLCRAGPFRGLSSARFAELLRDLAAKGLVTQLHTGELVLGLDGERLVNHYDFFAAFATRQEYRLVAGAETLGTIPVERPILPESALIFAGRRWRVEEVDESRKLIRVVPAPGGQPPIFFSGAAPVHDRVREEMQRVYLADDVPPFLDAAGRELLDGARAAFRDLDLDRSCWLRDDCDVLVFPWVGDRVLDTLQCLLRSRGHDGDAEGPALRVSRTSIDAVVTLLHDLRGHWPSDAEAVAATVLNKIFEKHHPLLGEALLTADYASSQLNLPGAAAAIDRMLELPDEV